ncbi:hypothetical protein FNH08_49985 [Streptomyces spongiae]|uniref:Uncharacterized protein n=1 Tax=Streptomyces spongiae TaxID=565072 RepID=A0A5N8Y051_9ACTN|nr:hypothetical protein [Streptomyces spongiae]
MASTSSTSSTSFASATSSGPSGPSGSSGLPGDLGVPELVAEAALLQARLDWFQSQLARLGERGHGPGAPPQG